MPHLFSLGAPSTGRRRATVFVAAAALVLASLVTGSAAAHAATPPTVTATSTVGTDRIATVKLTCGGAASCAGTTTLSLSTGGSKRVPFSLASRAVRTVNWKLTSAQYAAFVKKNSATLTVKGSTTKPAASTFTKKVTLRPAKPRLSTKTTTYTVPTSRIVPVALTCVAPAGCTASVALKSGKTTVAQTTVKTTGTRTSTVKLTLSASAYAALTSSGSAHALVVSETVPDAVSRTTTVTLRKTQPTPTPTPAPVRAASTAYAERNWTPTGFDTCPASLHKEYSVIGPDGKIYPTWHPAQVTDPATGALCTFGHEHGSDPASSDIFAWVADFYAPNDLTAAETSGLPFGYVSENLDDHISHGHSGMSMRHEDNGGHKVFLANNVKMLDADRNLLKLADGSQLVCDYLIKQHQGSWSPDATSNNAHETLYAAKCSDGTEIITSLLSRFGDANEMFSTCQPETPIATLGSTLPAGAGGKRIIPTQACVSANPTDWSLYEIWQAETAITAADGTVLAAFDPWFGIRNPSRLYDPTASTATTNGIAHPLNLAWDEAVAADDYLWTGLGDVEPFAVRDPRSPFNGAQRDFYLAEMTLATPNSTGIVYSDPYGGDSMDMPMHGYARQLINAGSVLGSVSLSRQKFDAYADFGKNNGVHAPN